MSAPDVIALDSFASHADEVGGKLRRLAALAAWGYRVPDGFAVTRTAVRGLAGRDLAAPFPAPLTAAIAREYERLCARLGVAAPVLAVRSAATAEDGDRRSFAGIYESVLGVRGLAQIEAAIRRCIASGAAARAASYHGGSAAGEMSVGVQELIPARTSGVAFSRHPVTHRDDRVVIEAVLGLASPMVDGMAQPDHIEIGRADRRVLRYVVGHKERRALPRSDGGVIVEEAAEVERRAQCLGDDEIDELCRATIDIESRLGRAVDLEWVVADDGEIVIIQARPITSGPRDARAPVRWDPLAYARQLGGAPHGV